MKTSIEVYKETIGDFELEVTQTLDSYDWSLSLYDHEIQEGSGKTLKEAHESLWTVLDDYIDDLVEMRDKVDRRIENGMA